MSAVAGRASSAATLKATIAAQLTHKAAGRLSSAASRESAGSRTRRLQLSGRTTPGQERGSEGGRDSPEGRLLQPAQPEQQAVEPRRRDSRRGGILSAEPLDSSHQQLHWE